MVHEYQFLALVFSLVLVFTSPFSTQIEAHNLHGSHNNFQTTTGAPGAICYQLKRLRLCSPVLKTPPSGSSPEEIDPRYGIEKRLVPSGPNPLHN
nr:CLAVATA3/ESR (CLE)-related protein 9-like [Ipomoea trifida]